MILCIQCALKALVEDKPYVGSTEETNEEHMRLHHPDPVATAVERQYLEQQAARKLMEREDGESA